MSYQIYYDRQFVKIDDKQFIPITCDGSNNCTQTDLFTGREVRERDFRLNTYFAPNIITTKEDLEVILEKMRKGYKKSYDDYSDESFCSYASTQLNGRGSSYKAFKSYYIGGAKTAKTVEELRLHHIDTVFFVYGGYNDENFKETGKEDLSTTVDTTEQLVLLIARAKKYYAETKIYFTVRLDANSRDMKRMRQSERVIKEKTRVEVNHFFTVNMENFGYISKCTSRGIRYSPYSTGGKRFRTEKEIIKRVKNLRKRYPSRVFEPVRVDKPTTFLV